MAWGTLAGGSPCAALRRHLCLEFWSRGGSRWRGVCSAQRRRVFCSAGGGFFSLARGVFGATPRFFLRRRRGVLLAGAGCVRRNAEVCLRRRRGWFSLARGVFGATPKGVLLRRRRFFCRQKKRREKDRSRGKPFDVSPLEKPLFPSTKGGGAHHPPPWNHPSD